MAKVPASFMCANDFVSRDNFQPTRNDSGSSRVSEKKPAKAVSGLSLDYYQFLVDLSDPSTTW